MKTTFYFKTKFLKKLKPLCTLSSVFLFLFIGFQEANAQSCVTGVPRTSTIAIGAAKVPTGWTMIGSPDGSSRSGWQNKYSHYVNSVATTPAPTPDGSINFLTASENPTWGIEAATAPFTVTTAGSELTVYLGGFSTSGSTGGRPSGFTVDAQDVHITLNGTRIDGVGTIAEDGGWHPVVFSNLAVGNYIFHIEPRLGAVGRTNMISLVVGPDNLCPTSKLPVDLIAFTTEPLGNKNALLHWTTANEINNSHFDIERSYDGKTFETVGEVAGNGNSQHQIEYSYTDASVSKVENTVYYRLKQVDFDGAYEYSDIRVVRFDAVGNDMQLVAYPNPMNDELNVMLSLPSGEKYQLQVTNLQGALVHQKNHVFSSGLHTLDLSQWNSGVYIVEVISDRGSEHIKVMKK